MSHFYAMLSRMKYINRPGYPSAAVPNPDVSPGREFPATADDRNRVCSPIRESMASMMTSGSADSSFSALEAVQKLLMGMTSASGLISRRRVAMVSVLDCPIVDANACICRLVLVMQRSSISIRMIVPTPDRARASAAQEPTPPMPTTAMRALLRRDSPLFPYRRPIPPNLASQFMITCLFRSMGD